MWGRLVDERDGGGGRTVDIGKRGGTEKNELSGEVGAACSLLVLMIKWLVGCDRIKYTIGLLHIHYYY